MVRSGHKLTEAGEIPDDWQSPVLGDLIVLMTNGFVGTATSHYSENNNGILYIQGYNVEENSFKFHGIKYVTEAFHKAHMKSCLKQNDLLTVQTGEVGLTTIVPKELEGSNCHALIISRFDQQKVFPKFISYYLNSFPGRSRLRLIETGTTMKHLNIADMLQFTVPLPPTKIEQEAIAEALSDADALIESLEKLIAKKRLIKQGAMQELLTGKKRLPGFGDAWKVHKLGDICEILMGRTPSRSISKFWGEGHVWLSIADLKTKVISDSKEKITELAAKNIPIIRKGTLLMSFKLSIGRLCFAGCDLYTNEAICSFNELRANPGFLYYALGRVDFSLYGKQAVKGYTLNKESLAAVEVSLPTEKEQACIAATLDDIDVEINLLEQKLTKAHQIKQGMMQELLTGRIRLI